MPRCANRYRNDREEDHELLLDTRSGVSRASDASAPAPSTAPRDSASSRSGENIDGHDGDPGAREPVACGEGEVVRPRVPGIGAVGRHARPLLEGWKQRYRVIDPEGGRDQRIEHRWVEGRLQDRLRHDDPDEGPAVTSVFLNLFRVVLYEIGHTT